jgi:capsular exopolysaccharide synthesis family protein
VDVSLFQRIPQLVYRARYLLPLAVAIGVVTVTLHHTWNPSYKAIARLNVRSKAPSPLTTALSQLNDYGFGHETQEIDRHYRNLHSDLFVELLSQTLIKVEDRFKYADILFKNAHTPRERAELLMRIATFKKEEEDILAVVVTHPVPEVAVEAANELTRSVREILLKMEATELDQAQSYLEDELDKSRLRINELFSRMATSTSNSKLDSVRNTGGLIDSRNYVEALEGEYEKISLDIEQKSILVKKLEEETNANITDRDFTLRGRLVDRIREIEADREELHAKQEGLKKRLAALYMSHAGQHDQKIFEFQKNVELELEIQKSLRKNMYDGKIEKISLESKLTFYNFADEGSSRPVSPLALKVIVTALLSALFMLTMLLAWDHLVPSLYTKDQIKILGVSWLANIPEHRVPMSWLSAVTGRDKPRALLASPMLKNDFAMSFQYLRLRLQQALKQAQIAEPVVMSVLSWSSADGKTTVASNLAMAWAQGGKKVLLVDCDMAKRSLNVFFPTEDTRGLSDFLAGGVKLKDVCHRFDAAPELHYMLAGDRPEILDSPEREARLRHFLEVVKPMFDLIILDTPAFNASSEALALSEISDIPLLVMQAGKIKMANAMSMIEAIAGFRTRPLLAVLNRHDAAQFSDYGYYKVSTAPRVAHKESA